MADITVNVEDYSVEVDIDLELEVDSSFDSIAFQASEDKSKRVISFPEEIVETCLIETVDAETRFNTEVTAHNRVILSWELIQHLLKSLPVEVLLAHIPAGALPQPTKDELITKENAARLLQYLLNALQEPADEQ